MDKFTETTYTSYGQNIGNSFKGIFFGIVFIIGSIVLLWWNEGRSVEQATALKEMEEKIITLPAPKYDAAVDGKAVLVQGAVKPMSEVVDPEFNVKTDGLVLRRQVEMYQWKENKESTTKDKLGGGTETTTTYEYVRTWSPYRIDSSSFQHPMNHENPMMNYKSESFNTDAMLGDFYLDRSMVGYVRASTTYAGLNSMPNQAGVARNYKSYLYIGMNPQTPMVGDIKITYTYAPAGEYTFAAKEEGKKLTHYVTENGKEFVFVRSGRVSAKTIFKEELDANAALTWILRGVGLLVMFFGFTMIMGPIAALAKVIPVLGSLASGVTSIVAAVLTLILGSVIIALAWFGSRPMLSLGIIGIGIALAVLLAKFGKKKVPSTSPQAATATASTPPARPESTPPPQRDTTPPQREDTVTAPDREEGAASSETEESTSPSRKAVTPPPRES
jgi:hypothetical protein